MASDTVLSEDKIENQVAFHCGPVRCGGSEIEITVMQEIRPSSDQVIAANHDDRT
jgi:hypothetical protein